MLMFFKKRSCARTFGKLTNRKVIDRTKTSTKTEVEITVNKRWAIDCS